MAGRRREAAVRAGAAGAAGLCDAVEWTAQRGGRGRTAQQTRRLRTSGRTAEETHEVTVPGDPRQDRLVSVGARPPFPRPRPLTEREAGRPACGAGGQWPGSGWLGLPEGLWSRGGNQRGRPGSGVVSPDAVMGAEQDQLTSAVRPRRQECAAGRARVVTQSPVSGGPAPGSRAPGQRSRSWKPAVGPEGQGRGGARRWDPKPQPGPRGRGPGGARQGGRMRGGARRGRARGGRCCARPCSRRLVRERARLRHVCLVSRSPESVCG